MFDKEIEFIAQEDYFELREDFPTPIKLNIPEWFKKLEHTVNFATVKGCIPFLDSLTSGYLLKIPQDFYIKHNVDNKNEENNTFKDSFYKFSLNGEGNYLYAKQINLNSGVDVHPIKQLEGSPLIEKNKNLPFYKILNPWKIKTPKGYSCLFLPPLNNSDDRFSIIPAIVDTDKFPNEINFPIVINGDKYPTLETIIKKGTPYVQIIPFKRETWKMTLNKIKTTEVKNNRIKAALKLLYSYKENYWSKKKWN
jgi:hypothetical protein